ncbi:MAG: hypothetical protein QOH96_386, partial [Blastocatellia bacterium]|nr:hypothetical protein [Blastocatellia bacterium]
VSGYSFPISGAGRSDAYFLPIISTWGWATWKRAWQFNDLNAMDAEGLLTNLQVRSRFNLENAYPYSDMLRDRLAGKNSSWGVMWYWSVFRRNGLVLFPQRSLIYNGGYDGSGVHCGKTDDPATVPIHEVLETRIPDPLILPDRLETAESDFQLVRSYLLKMQPAYGHGVGTLLRRIKRRLSL